MSDSRASRLQQALGAVDPQIWIVTAAADGRAGGLVATFVTKASIVPDCPRFVLGLAKQHHTWRLLEAAGCCGLHLIGPAQLDWVLRFGGTSGRSGADGPGKLAGLATVTLQTGAPLLREAPVAYDCAVEQKWDTGDRTVFLLSVEDARMAAAHALGEPSEPENREPAQTDGCLSPGGPAPELLRFSTMWPRLTSDQQQQLGSLLAHDQEIDRRAIVEWRNELGFATK